VSANVAPKASEPRRSLAKLNVGLTCDSTLTGAHSRGECEAVGERDTALITQRSQVQILPPLQRQNRRSAPGSWVSTAPVLVFDVSGVSADIASRPAAREAYYAKISEGWRRSRKLDLASSLPMTQRLGPVSGLEVDPRAVLLTLARQSGRAPSPEHCGHERRLGAVVPDPVDTG
jgi:hypothetical protein